MLQVELINSKTDTQNTRNKRLANTIKKSPSNFEGFFLFTDFLRTLSLNLLRHLVRHCEIFVLKNEANS